MGKEFVIVLLLGICFTTSFGMRRKARTTSWDTYDSLNPWLSSQDPDDEYYAERRSAPTGFSAVRGKRFWNPQNAALVSALTRLQKLQGRNAFRHDLSESLDNDDEKFGRLGQLGRYHDSNNDMDLPNYIESEEKRSSGKNYIPTDRREVPAGFFIARGKKHSDSLDVNEDDVPFRFFSSRGKKNSYQRNRNGLESYDSVARRAIPEGFYLSRGKRDLEVPTYGAEDQHLHVIKPDTKSP